MVYRSITFRNLVALSLDVIHLPPAVIALTLTTDIATALSVLPPPARRPQGLGCLLNNILLPFNLVSAVANGSNLTQTLRYPNSYRQGLSGLQWSLPVSLQIV